MKPCANQQNLFKDSLLKFIEIYSLKPFPTVWRNCFTSCLISKQDSEGKMMGGLIKQSENNMSETVYVCVSTER